MTIHTTCQNFECPQREQCEINIWDDSYKKRVCPQGMDYISEKEWIRFQWVKKNPGKSFGNYWED